MTKFWACETMLFIECSKLADAMKQHEFNRNTNQVKIKHLRDVFRNHKDKVNRSSAGSGKPPIDVYMTLYLKTIVRNLSAKRRPVQV